VIRIATLLGSLGRSCHPAPTAAVTVFTTVLAAVAGNSVATCALVAVAVLSGQLSIGWSNDRIDAARDRRAARTDKPLAAGELSRRDADVSIALALAATIGFSLALGWRAGLVHLGAVGCGWIYNLGVKASWCSWLPYALAFGALPAVATLALPTHPAPAAWAVASAALLGITANLTNPLPELDSERATGVLGLPHHLGARASVLLASGLLLTASVGITLGPPGPPGDIAWVLLGIAMAILAAATPRMWHRPASPASFYGIIAIAGLDLILVALTGHHLH
jgi:4-hydroxybenzoate polyprenyltransferase